MMCVVVFIDKSEKRLSRIATDSDLQRFVDGSKTDGVDGTKSQADITDFTQICQQLKAATPVCIGPSHTKQSVVCTQFNMLNRFNESLCF